MQKKNNIETPVELLNGPTIGDKVYKKMLPTNTKYQPKVVDKSMVTKKTLIKQRIVAKIKSCYLFQFNLFLNLNIERIPQTRNV